MIKRFKMKNGDSIIYDAKANCVFVLNDYEIKLLESFLSDMDEDEIIKSCSSKKIDLVKQTLDKFKSLRCRGVFLKGNASKVSSDSEEEIFKLVEYFDKNIFIRKFVLELTEDCNYRCKYCPNTVNTEYRKHSKRKMSKEVVEKAIDYYYNQYTGFINKLKSSKRVSLISKLPPTIGLYGGEPTLNYEVMKHAVNYFKKLPWEIYNIKKTDLLVTLNTNMSCINQEILEFLVTHDIKVYASLDGPKEENDKCRVFPNGEGTFDLTYSNLMKIKEYKLDYYKKNIVVLGVNSIVHNSEITSQFLSTLGCTFYQHEECQADCFVYDAENKIVQFKKRFDEELQCRKEIIDREAKTNENIENLAFLYDFEEMVYDNPLGDNYLRILKTCPMGKDNIMIGVDGDMHICHKTDGSMPFGNINEEFSYERLIRMYLKLNKSVNESGCSKCWIVNFCPVCAAQRMHKGEFISPSNDECEYMRQNTEMNFMLFLYTYEKFPKLIERIFKEKKDKKAFVSIVDLNEW